MAKQERAKYSYDEWIEQVRPDARSTDQLTLMQGYIGQSSESGHVRIYSDDSLNHFVEVPEDAIVYSVKLSPAESSLGGSKVWLRSDVVVTYGDPKAANRPKSTFLEGDLMQQYTTQYGGGYDQTAGAGAYGGQGNAAGQGGQFMASIPLILCGQTRPPQCLVITARTCVRTICGIQTCLRTVCAIQTCHRSLCGPQSCIAVLCGGPCQFTSRPPTVPTTITETITGPTGTIVQQGGFMGGQPDTTYMGGYYGTFNPYMM